VADALAGGAPVRSAILVGYGAMGRYVHEALRADAARLAIRCIVVQPGQAAALRALPGMAAQVVESVDDAPQADFALECAGHGAVTEAVPRLLRRGMDAIVASVGALGLPDVPQMLERAAQDGGAQLTLVPGAVAGIDALAAARQQGLDAVSYTGRKPPSGWLGTPAEQRVDLASLAGPATIFEGSAREAAALYPKNANVAAMVGLAGIGLDRTRVTLVADPGVSRNTHAIVASGAFGDLLIETAGKTLPDNPKTSMLAALSIVRAVRNRVAPIVI